MSDYEFRCPDCGQHVEVNGPMRDAILQNGCPVCAEPVAADSFSPT